MTETVTDIRYITPALAISNEKGGVGKTFISASLAEYAARFVGLRVLLIDTDIQCNLTALMVGLEQIPHGSKGAHYKAPPPHPDYDPTDNDQVKRPSVAGAFLGEVVMPYPTWINAESIPGIEGCVEILPAHGAKLEQVISTGTGEFANVDADIYASLFHVAQSEAIASHYDLVVFDTNPTRNILSRSVFRASTHVVIPMEFDVHSIDGIMSVQSTIETENAFRQAAGLSPLELIGLLPNRYVAGSTRSAGISKLHYEETKDLFDAHYLSEHSFIPQAEAVKKVLSGKHTAASIFDITKKSKAEFRLRMALEHACIEILHPLLHALPSAVDRLDKHKQRVRQEQKKFNKIHP